MRSFFGSVTGRLPFHTLRIHPNGMAIIGAAWMFPSTFG